MEVVLKREQGNHEQSFSKEVATRILRLHKKYPKAKGWVLSDEKLKFNGHDIIKRSSKKRTRKSSTEE